MLHVHCVKTFSAGESVQYVHCTSQRCSGSEEAHQTVIRSSRVQIGHPQPPPAYGWLLSPGGLPPGMVLRHIAGHR
jgi:hypothetical protein